MYYFSLQNKENDQNIEHNVKIPINICRFLKYEKIDNIPLFQSQWLLATNIHTYKFDNINPLIISDINDLHLLIKESIILNENCLIGKFSFFMLENTEIFYKILILKNEKHLLLKILIGAVTLKENVYFVNENSNDKGKLQFLNYFIRFVVLNMFEVLLIKTTKYDIQPNNIILELESDNSDDKLKY